MLDFPYTVVYSVDNRGEHGKQAEENIQRYQKTIDLYPSEQELIDHINKQPKKYTYIKNLIRQDIEKDRQPWKTIFI